VQKRLGIKHERTVLTSWQIGGRRKLLVCNAAVRRDRPAPLHHPLSPLAHHASYAEQANLIRRRLARELEMPMIRNTAKSSA
jgi:hypothetical protein